MENKEKTLDIIYLCLNAAGAYGRETEVILRALLIMGKGEYVNTINRKPYKATPEHAIRTALREEGILMPSGVLDHRRTRIIPGELPKTISFDPLLPDHPNPDSPYGDATVASFQGSNANFFNNIMKSHKMNTDPKEKEEVIVPPASDEPKSPTEPIHKEAGTEIVWPTIPVGGEDNVEPHEDTDVSRG